MDSPLVFKKWDLETKMKIGKFYINEPNNNLFEEPSGILVPFLAYDKNNYRLGYGGGFYDRTIAYLETKKKIVQNSKNFDLIITSGGISTSSIDKVSELLLSNGLINFWRLAIKPGRPIAFGKINKTPFIGLPGNPVAAIITFFMLITQFVEKVSGNQERKLLSRCFPSSFNMKKKRGRTEWLRGSIIKVKNKYLIPKLLASFQLVDINIFDNFPFLPSKETLKISKSPSSFVSFMS